MPIIEKNIHNLKFQNNEDGILSFSKFLGKYLILYFYPRDNTSGCTKEAKDFSNLKLEFDSLNTIVIGISSDTYESHNKFISKHDLKIELISDIDNNLCQYFGVWVEKNMYGKKFMGIERSTFLIDPSGIIIKEWRKVKVISHAEELLNYLRKIKK
ncbi:peroxiredoxin [Amylibacter sp.]|nr:peroxiredoxin [Amylibacter sp.]